jgi:hypothetical protein
MRRAARITAASSSSVRTRSRLTSLYGDEIPSAGEKSMTARPTHHRKKVFNVLSSLWLAWGHRAAVDQQVNDWLARSNVEVRKTSTAFKAFRESGWDAISGRTTSRRALEIAISVWYDEPVTKVIGNRPTDWTFGQ